MSKVVFSMTVTDDDIRYNVLATVKELEADKEIEFPDSEAREEVIEDTIDTIIDKYESRPDYFWPDFETEVLDIVDDYGYRKDD